MKSRSGTTRRSFLRRSGLLASAAVVGPSVMLTGRSAWAASDWPTRPITLIVPFPAGGSSDALARAMARHVEQKTSQVVVVDNRAGAGGTIGVRAVANAEPDGYTFGWTIGSSMNQSRVMYKSLPYNPDKDFVFAGAVDTAGLTLAVHKGVPARNLAELIEMGKKQPVNIGSYGPGSFPHMFVQQVNKLYGTQLQAVHYKGETPMWQDLAGGQAHAAIGSYGSFRPFLERGDIRPIGQGGKERLPVMPDLPLFSEEGFKEDVFTISTGWIGLIAPAATPKPIVERMSELFVEAFSAGDGAQLLATRGLYGPVMDATAHNTWQREQGAATIELVKQLGITLD